MKRSNSITKSVNQFAELIRKGWECWVKAGEIYVEAIEADPEFAERVLAAVPELTPSILRKFEMLGRQQLHPRLLLMDGPGVKKLRAMPYSTQAKHLADPIEMLVIRGEETDTLMVDVKELSTEAARQVFASDHVRSLPEQRSYIEASRALSVGEPKDYETPWEVKRGKVYFNRTCTLTRQEMAAILASMA